MHPDTIAVALGRGGQAPGDPLNVPPIPASAFVAGGRIDYGRESNPTWEALETVLGALEHGTAQIFGSGVAAIAAVVALVPPGAVVVAPRDAYAGTRRLLHTLADRDVIVLRLVEITDTDETLDACDGGGLLWVESPTNPLLGIADIPALCAGAHARGAFVAVDNTFATPLLQRPLQSGADVVVHSATKYLSGHSDVILGATVAADPEVADRLADHRTTTGAIPGPVDAWLALRGLRTLPLRFERAQSNAGVLASRLAEHAGVQAVRYPGLPGDPHHQRARRLMDGFGAIVSFDMEGADRADAVCAAVRLASHATSLGGVETTLERRARQAGDRGVPPGLIRLSVGIEHVEDLWADLAAALELSAR